MRALRSFGLRPSTWVAIAVLSVPLSSASGGGGASITVSDLAVVVFVCLAALDVVRGGNAAAVRSVPAVGFLVLGLASVVTALVAQNFPDNVVGAVRFVELFCLAPIAVMVALRSRTDAWLVIGSLVGLAVVQGAVGVVQTLTGTGADIGGERIRAVGTFGAYNIGALAGLCAMALLASLAIGVTLTGSTRWWALGTAAFLVVPLAFSLSRSAWVATAVAAVLVVSRGRPLRLLAVGAAGAVLAAVALPVVEASGSDLADRLTSVFAVGSDPDQSFVDRLALWDAAGGMAVDHPWAGVGPRAFVEHRDAYADLSLLGSSDIAFGDDFEQVALESPHSFYLLVASEQGLIAATLYVAVFLVLLARGLVRSSRPRSDLSTAMALAGTGLLAFHLVDMVNGDLGGPSSIMLAVSLGLAGWAAADLPLQAGGRTPPSVSGSTTAPAPAPPGAVPVTTGGPR